MHIVVADYLLITQVHANPANTRTEYKKGI